MDQVTQVQISRLYSCLIQVSELLLQKIKEARRRWWTKSINTEEMRKRYGAYNTIFYHFKLKDSEEFLDFTGTTVPQFMYLLHQVDEKLLKHSHRKALVPELRLAVTLQ